MLRFVLCRSFTESIAHAPRIYEYGSLIDWS